MRRWAGLTFRAIFLSSNAQDIIEYHEVEYRHPTGYCIFLSSNAQDFIEEGRAIRAMRGLVTFLSSNAQDFIEDRPTVWEPLKSFDS